MSKKDKKIQDVFSFLIPMLQDHLLMPSEAVAEIVPFINVSLFEGVEETNDWHIGNLSWRNTNVPVISLERINGRKDLGDIKRSRIAVLYTLNNNHEIPYLAFTVQGIPRILPISDENSQVLESEVVVEGIAAWVKIGKDKALIPDMDALEKLASTIS